jgi:hypothetical protein
MLYLCRLFYRFSTIPFRIPADFFIEIDKLIPKFIWNGKRSRIAKIILKKKKKVGGFTLFNFKT